MTTHSSDSMIRQRLQSKLVIVFSLILLTCFVLSYTLTVTNYKTIQPTFAQSIPVPVLSDAELSIQFHSSNNALRRLSADDVNALSLSPQVESLLREMANDLPESVISAISDNSENNEMFSQDALTRFQFLINKALPEQSAKTINAVLPDYFRYLHAEKNLLETAEKNSAEATPQRELERLTRTKQLRQQYLGEVVARQLFGSQELLGEYMLRRQVIMLDESLTEDEKKLALQQAEEDFQHAQSAFETQL